jgi:hypothetical protein
MSAFLLAMLSCAALSAQEFRPTLDKFAEDDRRLDHRWPGRFQGCVGIGFRPALPINVPIGVGLRAGDDDPSAATNKELAVDDTATMPTFPCPNAGQHIDAW